MVQLRKAQRQDPSLAIAGKPSLAPEADAEDASPFLARVRPRLTRIQLALTLALFACTLFLRAYDLSVFPLPFITSDEFHYPWVGMSLLNLEKPQAWSFLKAYEDLNLRKGRIFYNGHPFLIVQPAFDHPPLFSLVAGGFARLTGAKQIEVPLEYFQTGMPLFQPTGNYIGKIKIWDFDLGRVRLLTAVLFACSFFLLFSLIRRAYSFSAAFWSCLFYGTIMHVVAHGRLIVTEALLAPLLLGNLYVLQSYLAGNISRRKFGLLTTALVAAAPLTKLIAFGHAAIIVYLLLIIRRKKELIFPIAGALLGLALYLAYGATYGWEAFRAVLASQSGRFNGFDAIEHIILQPYLFQKANFSYVLFVGWLAVFAAAYAARGASLLMAPLIYLLIFVFFAEATGIWGWHLIVFYPFLCLGLGLLAAEGWKGENPIAYLLIVLLFVPFLFQQLYLTAGKSNPSLYRYAYLLLMGVLLGVVNFLPKSIRCWGYRLATAGIMGLVVANEIMQFWPWMA